MTTKLTDAERATGNRRFAEPTRTTRRTAGQSRGRNMTPGTTANGPATITVTGSAEQAKPENETWWQRWRKRGLVVGLASVVAAVAAVLQLYGWVPWR